MMKQKRARRKGRSMKSTTRYLDHTTTCKDLNCTKTSKYSSKRIPKNNMRIVSLKLRHQVQSLVRIALQRIKLLAKSYVSSSSFREVNRSVTLLKHQDKMIKGSFNHHPFNQNINLINIEQRNIESNFPALIIEYTNA